MDDKVSSGIHPSSGSSGGVPVNATSSNEQEKLIHEKQSSHGTLNDHQSAQPTHRPPFFGIPAYQGHAYVDRSYDYTRKYQPDTKGKETDPDARIWKVYLDESESYDNDMVKAFRDTIDAMLVFAALFSSVVSTFISESMQALEPDYAQINTNLLFEQNQLLRAAGNASKIEAVPKSSLGPESVTHSSSDIYANWMFFASLSVSLAAALLSVLVKQWLQEFTSVVSGDARQRSLVRQFRFGGLRRWKLSEIINILPVFLHLSLMLFLIGLCIFVEDFHESIFAVVCFVTAASFSFYIITAALPAVHLDCPYRLAILYLPACLVVHAFRELRFAIMSRGPRFPFPTSRLRSQELKFVMDIRKSLEASCISWLFDQSTNPSVQQVSLDAAARFLQPSIGAPYYNKEEEEVGKLLPLAELCSHALHMINVSQPQLEDSGSSLDFLTKACYMNPTSLPPDAWHVAIHFPALLRTFLLCGVPNDVQYSVNHNKAFPLQHACCLDLWESAKLLIPDSPLSHFTAFDLGGFTPLGRASTSKVITHSDWLAVIKLSKQRGVDVTGHAADREGSSIWHLVCWQRNVAAVQHLTETTPKRDCNRSDRFQRTPFHRALGEQSWREECRVPIVKLLLAHDADVTAVHEHGSSGFHHACFASSASVPILEAISAHMGDGFKALVNEGTRGWQDTPLHLACRLATPPAIDILLSAGANPNTQNVEGQIPLHKACTNILDFQSVNDIETFKRLLTATENINVLSKEGKTPLNHLVTNAKRMEEGSIIKQIYDLMCQSGALSLG